MNITRFFRFFFFRCYRKKLFALHKLTVDNSYWKNTAIKNLQHGLEIFPYKYRTYV